MKLRATAYSVLFMLLLIVFIIDDSRLSTTAQRETPEPTAIITPAPTPARVPTVVDHIRTLMTLYTDTFASQVNNRDIEGVYDLMIDRLIPLCVARHTNTGPEALCGQPAEWVNYISALNFDYELIVSLPQVSVINGAAITISGFDERIGGQTNAFGTDVFVYLQTPDGWRLATMNVVITDVEDINDRGEAPSFNPSPARLLNSTVEAFNQQDMQSLRQKFQPGAMVFDTAQIQENGGQFVSVLFQRAPDVFLRWFERSNNIQLTVDHVMVDIHDDYTASASTYYTLTENGSVVETGQQLWTFIASQTVGWQVTALVFSPDRE